MSQGFKLNKKTTKLFKMLEKDITNQHLWLRVKVMRRFYPAHTKKAEHHFWFKRGVFLQSRLAQLDFYTGMRASFLG